MMAILKVSGMDSFVFTLSSLSAASHSSIFARMRVRSCTFGGLTTAITFSMVFATVTVLYALCNFCHVAKPSMFSTD